MCPLGMLYRPSGLALETAMAVLETEEEHTYACNVAFGCSNACLYCYVPRFTRRRRSACEVKLPQKPPVELVQHQLEKQWRFHWTSKLGVFLSFLTDPFLPEVKNSTHELIHMLMHDHAIRVATLSKLATSHFSGVRQGMTIVSLSDEFWREYEPKTTHPQARLLLLRMAKENGDYVWVSMEPYPPSAIYKQNLQDLLEELSFVDLIIFGMWNYDQRACTEQARQEYAENVQILTDFCKENNIRLHVKSDTLKFIAKEK